MNRLQKALRAVKLDQAEPTRYGPHAVVASNLCDLRILLESSENWVHEEEEHHHGQQNCCDDYSRPVQVDSAHFVVVLAIGPRDKAFDCAIQAHRHGEDEDI